ncbi:phenylacetate--CoA ligase family protein, partial [Candidatus Bipolaricaulota bacterium]|nr:phenylacetate--CoA ligase family protein [Candidatus Bipolaricaulota bacterium]
MTRKSAQAGNMTRSYFRRRLMRFGYCAKGRGSVLAHYAAFMASQNWPYEQLRSVQEERLRLMMKFVEAQVPYYRRLLDSLGLSAEDIGRLEDLQSLPALTKSLIRAHQQDIIPSSGKDLRYVMGSTGGSTGDPLKYRMSLEDRDRGVALLYRGWGNGGYRPGDSVAIIAGSSLVPSARASIRKRLQGFVLNTHFLSSFGMDDETVSRYLRLLNRTRPRFIRGYATAVYFVAKHIQESGMKLAYRPTAVFTTAEKLFDTQRDVIEQAFETEVFDNYGLNDGGVSAYECPEHQGMHVDTERAILEVVDEDGQQIMGKPGRILATSLFNDALPFIRYETGDIGTLVDTPCPCGSHTQRLMNVLGRTTDLLTINGKTIASPVLTILFGKCDIEQYQIIQEASDTVTCRIVKGESYTSKDENLIRTSLIRHIGEASIRFKYE